MSIGRLKARADELSRDASVERDRCRTSVRNALAIVRRRAGSQAGLAFAFSLGFIAGAAGSLKNRKPDRAGRARAGLSGTVLGTAVRLAVPVLTNALVVASQDGGAGPGAQTGRGSPPSAPGAAADAASSVK